MALTGLQIFKLLAKTNCKECGYPTCLAFAMALAAGKADLSACPYVSEETKKLLSEASAPPIRTVTVGVGEEALKVGGETVAFRHEKRFENPPGLAILIPDTLSPAEVENRIQKLKQYRYERVGLLLKAELVALKNESGDPNRFEALVRQVMSHDGFGIILMGSPEALSRAVDICADRRPLLCGADAESAEKVGRLALEKNCPLVARADSLDALADLSNQLAAMGVKDLVLDPGSRTLRKAFEDQVIIRRAALEKRFAPFGFPTIAFPCEMTADPMKEALLASIFIAKYGGIIVLSDFEGHSLFPLLLERMNLFTDPQRPMATSEGIYEINQPDENAPVLVTTNFSLTYFIVSGEIENSRVPSWLLVVNSDGLSVLTAWAAGKFSADGIAAFMKRSGIFEKVKHRKLIIPGYVAAISGDLEEELPGWEILVGPREAAHIPAYLKNWR